MSDLTDRDILLKQWEQRYESYRSIRGQYLLSISITFTIWVLGISFALRNNISDGYRPYLLGFFTILMLIYFAAQLFTRKEVRLLGDRIAVLEKSLGMQEYRTTGMMERAVLYTIVAVCFAFLLSVFLTIRSIGVL